MTTPRDAHSDPSPHDEPALAGPDAEALDALVQAEWDLSRIKDPEVRALVKVWMERHLGPIAALSKMEPCPQPDASLVDATLARIDREESARCERLRADGDATKGRSGGRGIRIPDFITVAALLLIGIAIFFPVASRVRHSADLTACAANFGDLFQGMDCYADDHNGYAPQAAFVGSLFDRPRTEGLTASDEAMESTAEGCLHTLESRGYCHGACTKCCGKNPISIRIPMHRTHLILAYQQETPLASDANPFICRLRQGQRICAESSGYRMRSEDGAVTGGAQPACGQVLDGGFLVVDPLTNSPNHDARGQNVLGGDGSVRWFTTPVMVGLGHAESDNIWLPRAMDGVERFQFSELREDPFEIVLAH